MKSNKTKSIVLLFAVLVFTIATNSQEQELNELHVNKYIFFVGENYKIHIAENSIRFIDDKNILDSGNSIKSKLTYIELFQGGQALKNRKEVYEELSKPKSKYVTCSSDNGFLVKKIYVESVPFELYIADFDDLFVTITTSKINEVNMFFNDRIDCPKFN